jgi:tRNA A37 threonylcarbamoyladenosine dehydratase
MRLGIVNYLTKSRTEKQLQRCHIENQLQQDSGYTDRFRGLMPLYGDNALEKLKASHLCIIGIGGVGSWTAEALARSGVGTITLVDLDEVCISNTNR